MTPIEKARRSRKRFIITLVIVILISGFFGLTVASYNYYIYKLTHQPIESEGEGPVSINETLEVESNEKIKELLGNQELYTKVTSDDTRAYSIGTTSGTIIITRIATGVNQDSVNDLVKAKVGETKTKSTYDFPSETKWSKIQGYQCTIAGQKMIMGYYLNEDGYLYNITYSVSEKDFSNQFNSFLKVIDMFNFKITNKAEGEE